MSLESELAANTAALVALTEALKSGVSASCEGKKTRKTKTDEAAAPAENPAPAAVVTAPPAPVTPPPAPVVAAPTVQDVRAAATALLDADMKANGGSDAIAKKTFAPWLAKFSVARISETPESGRAEVIADLKRATEQLSKAPAATDSI
jgi:hypothetical protein